jgi:ankyrin repeat protein
VTALEAAAIGGYIGVAKILLDAGADTCSNKAAIEEAAKHGRIDMVQLLLNADTDLYGNKGTQYEKAIELASMEGNNAVRRLIEAHLEARSHS